MTRPGLLLALWAADASADAAPSELELNAGACLTPAEGWLRPRSISPRDRIVHDLLLPDTGASTVMQFVAQPSYDRAHAVYAVRLERLV